MSKEMSNELTMTKANNYNSARIAGTFCVTAQKYLCVWNPNRGDSGSWQPLFDVTDEQIAAFDAATERGI